MFETGEALEAENGGAELDVLVDVINEHLDYFSEDKDFDSLCTAVTLDETRERTSVSWMHNPCSGHVDSSQIWGPPLIGQCFI